MNKPINRQNFFWNIISIPALVLLTAFPTLSKTAIPVFLLAGQSNMSGYASANDLTTDQKQTVENVKIYVDMTWENNGKLKKWMTLVGINFGSGTANQGQCIGPELYFGRTLSEAMPEQKIALIKVCCGSTYLGNYAAKASDCWVPPSSNNGNAGPHYKRMLTAINDALKTFNSAFDTTKYTPLWAGFVWLQGEFDGQVKTLADAYEANLTCLINDVRKDLKVADLPAIIPMIDVQGSWQYNSTIRAAEVSVTKKLKNVDTLDTKGFSTDNVHYKAQGQVKIGTITAQRWLNMKFVYDPSVSVNKNHHLSSVALLSSTQSQWNRVVDLSGRQIPGNQCVSASDIISSRSVYIVTKNEHGSEGLKIVKMGK